MSYALYLIVAVLSCCYVYAWNNKRRSVRIKYEQDLETDKRLEEFQPEPIVPKSKSVPNFENLSDFVPIVKGKIGFKTELNVSATVII